jgi:hypothetical protein
MRTISKTAKIAVAGVSAATLAMSGVAYAYWSTSGTGTGSAATGSSSAFVVTSDPATGDPLTPGGPSQTVAFHVNNPSAGHQYLSAVAITVAEAGGGTWDDVAGCSAADYTVGTPSFTGGDMAPGTTINGTVTITMNNLASNQDACEGATVPLYIAAS